MPRKNAMRDNVSAVRSRLPQLMNAPREQIELALLYYESNVDETVEAFKQNGAVEALSGWTEMNNGRGNNSNKRSNNKSGNKSTSQTPPSNAVLRPSQRVSNIFQTFAEGGTPQTTHSNSQSTSMLTNHRLESYPSTDLSFHPCLSQDSAINNSDNTNEYHDTSNVTTISSTTTDETNHFEQDKSLIDEKPVRRRSIRERTGSTLSNHEQIQHENKNESTKSTGSTNDNKKLLSKSTKDLQRQTSTLSNVELSFENEIKTSLKRIDDVFSQLREILKEREVQLYCEMDNVKEQGLNIIRRRQERALELRQRVHGCDRLELGEIDNLRTDIKHFVTSSRYELGEELTSTHRFEYDENLVELLKNFGTVLRIDRKDERSRTLSTSSQKFIEQNGNTSSAAAVATTTNQSTVEPNLTTQQALPQRFSNKTHTNGNHAGAYHSTSQTNGFHHYYDDSYNYQTTNRRRHPQQQQNGNSRRTRPPPSATATATTTNSNNRRNGYNNGETTKTYRRPKPSPPQQSPVVPPLSN